ncbi:MAG TPA: aminotransferase class V-fold PLP-dependent enzyme [Solirubrobacteraceae bacterium]|nr:aminotransferase class V-fold PLP-dependent enzyme [Solirubrobacteraceae bacterium]
MLTLDEARQLFSPETTYLNTASYGLPPRPAFEALQAVADQWRHGRTSWHDWDGATGSSRATWARMHGVPASWVAVGNQVSSFAGLVAMSLPRGSRVVCAHGDFTSVLWPFLAAPGVEVDMVDLEDVPSAVDSGTSVVAVSSVQSLDGRVVDLDGIASACESYGARSFIDATQSSGWLPLDATRFDYVAASGYKWLLSPRGVCFMSIRPEAAEPLVPYLAGWYAGDEPFDTNYGAPMRLASDASRFDLSPAWLSWVGTAPALEVLDAVGVETIHEHDVGLANRFLAALGRPPGNSAIVSVPAGSLGPALRAAGVVATEREGMMRFSFHVYTTAADVDRALEAVADQIVNE